MLKSELVQVINQRFDFINEKDATLCVDLIINKMIQSLKNDQRIEIRGFGSFTLHHRPPHQAFNPRTGEPMYNASRYAIHFKPGQPLIAALNPHLQDADK